jgi:hypothetical protein
MFSDRRIGKLSTTKNLYDFPFPNPPHTTLQQCMHSKAGMIAVVDFNREAKRDRSCKSWLELSTSAPSTDPHPETSDGREREDEISRSETENRALFSRYIYVYSSRSRNPSEKISGYVLFSDCATTEKLACKVSCIRDSLCWSPSQNQDDEICCDTMW